MKSVFAFVFLTSCGYRALYATPAGEKFHVSLSRISVANGAVGEEVANGAREELSRQGALASGNGYPRLEIEVTGASETSEGIEVPVSSRDPNASSLDRTPIARGTSVGIIARGWIVRAPNGQHESETGDLRAEDLVTSSDNSVTATFVYQDTERVVARRLGHKIAARALGDPAVTDRIP